MEIYALQSAGNCGKSSTIKEVFNILNTKYPNCVRKNYFPGAYDIKIEMINVNGHIVGIESQGDPNSRLQSSLNDFEKNGCDIIICACRTSGMTVQWINSHSPKYHVNFIKQTFVGNNQQQQAQRNINVANNIIKQAGL
jgi:hypothetical protein